MPAAASTGASYRIRKELLFNMRLHPTDDFGSMNLEREFSTQRYGRRNGKSERITGFSQISP